MCTLVLAYQPEADWPLILGANRDEMASRLSLPPGRHWPDRPHVLGGKDLEAGGTWLGLGNQGLVAGILNRPDSLGPLPNKRSRGELVLMALDYEDSRTAVKALAQLDGRAYRPFNMAIVDNHGAFWLRSLGNKVVEHWPLPPGISLITAYDRNDLKSLRIRMYLPLFEQAQLPEPERDRWETWEALLSSHEFDNKAGPTSAMSIVDEGGFGTVSSALIALPSASQASGLPLFRFANGRPDKTAFENIVI